MSNINIKVNKSVIIALGILAVLALGLIAFTPFKAHAQTAGGDFYDARIGAPDYRFGATNTTTSTSTDTVATTKPVIDTITPNSTGLKTNATVTIVGYNFNPHSLVRVNGSDRFPVFVDSTKLVIQLTTSDTATSGTKTISVLNPGPQGGLSNSVSFKIGTGSVKSAATAKKSTTTKTTAKSTNTVSNESEYDYGALTSNALYGSNSFLPTGLMQWILVAILILIIVIIARKIANGPQSAHGHGHAAPAH